MMVYKIFKVNPTGNDTHITTLEDQNDIKGCKEWAIKEYGEGEYYSKEVERTITGNERSVWGVNDWPERDQHDFEIFTIYDDDELTDDEWFAKAGLHYNDTEFYIK